MYYHNSGKDLASRHHFIGNSILGMVLLHGVQKQFLLHDALLLGMSYQHL
jgi:hypothetical protein